MSETADQFKERIAKLRQLRERTGAGVAACDEALKACDGDVEAAAEHPATRRTARDTPGPFLHCPHIGGMGVNHRGQLYHMGCPEEHGERLAPPPRPRIWVVGP